MTDARAGLEALAKRCESEWASRELDATIENLLSGGSAEDLAYILSAIERITRPPAYTSSLDAAVSLVPKNSWRETCGPRRYLHIPSPVPNYWRTDITCWDISKEGDVCDGRAWAATEALSICAAALRARAAMEAA